MTGVFNPTTESFRAVSCLQSGRVREIERESPGDSMVLDCFAFLFSVAHPFPSGDEPSSGEQASAGGHVMTGCLFLYPQHNAHLARVLESV